MYIYFDKLQFAIQSVPQTFLFMPDGSSQLVPIEKLASFCGLMLSN